MIHGRTGFATPSAKVQLFNLHGHDPDNDLDGATSPDQRRAVGPKWLVIQYAKLDRA